jgi:hypothetical protein
VALAVFCSCLKKPDSIIVADVSDILSLRLNQSLGENRTFQIDLAIQEFQNCEEVKINSNLIEISSDLILEINAIEKPEDCVGEQVEIVKSHSINSPHGKYPFRIELADATVNIGQIDISENKVQLTFTELEGIQIEDAHVLRIPDNTVWGYIYIEEAPAELTDIQTMLFTEFNTNINAGLTLGNYGRFEIYEDQSVSFKTTDVSDSVTKFYMSSEEIDWNLLGEKLDEWKLIYPNLIYLLTNEKGDTYSS